jgi:hypothetical protein
VPLQKTSHSGGGSRSGSITSFADFMSAPGRGRKGKAGKSTLSRISNSANGHVDGQGVGEVLFDEGNSGKEVGAGVNHLKEGSGG